MAEAGLRISSLRETGRKLGEGSYGEVVEVQVHGVTYAAKKLHALFCGRDVPPGEKADIAKRFEDECLRVQHLKHPNIITTIGVHFHPHTRQQMLVMELLDASLRHYLDENASITPTTKYSILLDVATGLAYLHSLPSPLGPIVHRDLTANNVLLALGGEIIAKIADLGQAKVVGRNPAQLARSNPWSKVPGNVAHMPPEAFLDEPQYDTKLDVFSFGVVMLHTLTQEWPEPSSDRVPAPSEPAGYRMLTEIERRVKYLDKMSGHPLQSLVLECLDSNAEKRPTTTAVHEVVEKAYRLLIPHMEETGEELGSGVYGTVVEVRVKGERYAGKRLHAALCGSKKDVVALSRRFETECWHLSQLQHRNIITMIGIYLHPTSMQPTLVMELMDGSLSHYLQSHPNTLPTVKYSILLDVTTGLAYLHSLPPPLGPIVHRDLTANNVLLALGGEIIAKIADLGQAKVVGRNPAQLARSNPWSKVPGNVAHMPPEAFLDEPQYDTKLDVFSFGVVMLHTLTQEWPEPSSDRVPAPSEPAGYRMLTEIERRVKYLEKISGHPLQSLVLECLDSNAEKRPTTTALHEVVEKAYRLLIPHMEETGEELGSGAYGTVVEVRVKGERYAGKRLHAALCGSKKDVVALSRRFETECWHLSQLQHRNIITMIGIYLHPTSMQPTLVMELMDGSLSHYLQSYPNTLPTVKYSILLDVATGLAYLHSLPPPLGPIVHRDLTANNVLLALGGEIIAKIADLGQAKVIGRNPAQLARSNPWSKVPGNVAHMPPEAFLDEPQYDTKLDVFSFGVVMLHTLTQEWPEPSSDRVPAPSEPAGYRMLTEIERRVKYLEKISGHPLHSLITDCLNNDPQKRPTSTTTLGKIKDGSRVPVSARGGGGQLQPMGSNTVGLAPLQGGFARQPRAGHPNSAFYQPPPISAQRDDTYQLPPYDSPTYQQLSKPDAISYKNMPTGQPMSEYNTYQNLQEDTTVTQQIKQLYSDVPELVGQQLKPISNSAGELHVRADSQEEYLYGDDNQLPAGSTVKCSTADIAASPRSEQCSCEPDNLHPPELKLLASTPASEYGYGGLDHLIDMRSGVGSGRLSPLNEQPRGLGDRPDPPMTDPQEELLNMKHYEQRTTSSSISKVEPTLPPTEHQSTQPNSTSDPTATGPTAMQDLRREVTDLLRPALGKLLGLVGYQERRREGARSRQNSGITTDLAEEGEEVGSLMEDGEEGGEPKEEEVGTPMETPGTSDQSHFLLGMRSADVTPSLMGVEEEERRLRMAQAASREDTISERFEQKKRKNTKKYTSQSNVDQDKATECMLQLHNELPSKLPALADTEELSGSTCISKYAHDTDESAQSKGESCSPLQEYSGEHPSSAREGGKKFLESIEVAKGSDPLSLLQSDDESYFKPVEGYPKSRDIVPEDSGGEDSGSDFSCEEDDGAVEPEHFSLCAAAVDDTCSQSQGASIKSPSPLPSPRQRLGMESFYDDGDQQWTESSPDPEADIWVTVPHPCRGHVQSICLSDRLLWLVDSRNMVYCTDINSKGKKWELIKHPMQLVTSSPSGSIVWGLYRQNAYVRLGIELNMVRQTWKSITRNTSLQQKLKYVCADDSGVWAVKADGQIIFRKGVTETIPHGRVWVEVGCAASFTSVTSCSGVVWATTASGRLFYRDGVSEQNPSGRKWVDMKAPPLKAVCMTQGNIAWIIDSEGKMGFRCGISRAQPMGKNPWWEVNVSTTLSHSSLTWKSLWQVMTRSSLIHTLLPGHHKLLAVSASNRAGVCVLESGSKLHICWHSTTGYHYSSASEHGLFQLTTWTTFGSGSTGTWAVRDDGELYCVTPQEKFIRIECPSTVQMMTVSSTALWIIANNQLWSRLHMSAEVPEGISWDYVELSPQLQSRRLKHIVFGKRAVWAIDGTGIPHFRFGVHSREPGTGMSPAWVPVDDLSHPLHQITVSQNDWLVWARDKNYNAYARTGVTQDSPVGKTWDLVPGQQVKQLCAYCKKIYALTPSGNLLGRYGITESNAQGNYWRQMPGHFVQIAIGPQGRLLGLDSKGSILKQQSKTITIAQDSEFLRHRFDEVLDQSWEVV